MPAPAALRVLLAAVLLAVAGLASAAELDPVLDRIEHAYGAAPAPGSILQRGRTWSQTRGEGSLLRAYRGHERFRVEIRYRAGTETRIIDGPRAWQSGKPMSDIFRGALILQAARVALPWNLLATRDTLKDGGEHKVGETQLRFIEMPLGKGLRIVAEVETDSGRILRSRGILTEPRGSEMEFGTVYEEFRTVDGRLFASVEHHYAMGRYTGRSVIESVEYDVPIADFLFRPDLPGVI